MNPALPGIAAAALYLLCVASQIRGLKQQTQPPRSRILSLVVPALLLHAVTLWLVMNRIDGVDLSLFAIASLVMLVMILFVLAASHWQPLENLFVLLCPLGAVAVLGAALTAEATHPYEALSAGLVAHALLSLAAYTVLAMAATQALALTAQERALRAKRAIALLRLLPPLLSMEKLLFQLLWSGLVLLTLSIASGFAFLTDMFAQHVVHHTVLALVAWLIFAGLLLGHLLLGWRGIRATRWTLTGFAVLALAYFGSKFVLEVLLS